MSEFAALAGIIQFFLILMVIIWFFLPFAIFGIKKRLDDLIDIQRQILEQMVETHALTDQE